MYTLNTSITRPGARVSQDDIPTSPCSIATRDEDWYSTMETLKDGDTDGAELHPEDIIIALMGATGCGKSTFINTIMKENLAKVGHSLLSCTKDVETYTFIDPRNGRKIIFVDTPGFNDTSLSDFIILDMLTQWLKKTYSAHCKLSAIFLFHRISDNRMTQSAIHNIELFRNLCGNHSLKNVILVTNMWDELTQEAGIQREKQLRASYFSKLLEHGARMHRHNRTYESCQRIIDRVRHLPKDRTALLVQQEMVDKHLPFEETTVAATLKKRLIELIADLTSLIAAIKGPSDEDRKVKEEQKSAILRKQLKKLERGGAPKHGSWTFSPFKSKFKRPSYLRRPSADLEDDFEVISQSDYSVASPTTPSSASSGASSKLSSTSFDLYYGVYTSLDEGIKVLKRISDNKHLAVEVDLVKAIDVSMNVAKALKQIIKVDGDLISLMGRVAFFLRAVWDCQDYIDDRLRVILRQLNENLELLERVAIQASRRIGLLRLTVRRDFRPFITKCHELITSGCDALKIENIIEQESNIARLERLVIKQVNQGFDRAEARVAQELAQRPVCACQSQPQV